MGLTKKRVYKNSKQSKASYSLYESAFPPIEKLPYRMMIKYDKSRLIDFWAYYDEDKYIGFAYIMLTKKYAYLLFCATVKEERSKGFGTAIINELKQYYSDKAVVLDIEPIDDTKSNAAQRRKRLEFYEKNGFSYTGYKMVDNTGEFVILSNCSDFDLEDFKNSFKLFPPMFDGTQIVSYTIDK